MTYFYLNIFLITVLIFVFSRADYSNVFSSSKSSPTIIPTIIPTPTIAPPVRLIVPKLGIDAEIEPVNVDENNIVGVPDSWDRAGWYLPASKPGEIGTAVIVGHYDDQTGVPAIFYYLNELEKEDKITVLTEDQKGMDFIIEEKTTFPYWSSIDDLIKNDKKRSLILITCSGWWNQALQSYSERLVIRSVRTN